MQPTRSQPTPSHDHNATEFEDDFPDARIYNLSADASLGVYRDTLKALQLKYSELRKAHRSLINVVQRMEKEQENNVTSPAVANPVSSGESLLKSRKDDTRALAKKFAVLYDFFASSYPSSMFSLPRPDVDFTDPKRYRDEESKEGAVLAELYYVFPAHLHSFIGSHSEFNHEFHLGFKSIKSSVAERVRQVAPFVFSGLPSSAFQVAISASNPLPDSLRRLCTFPPKDGTTSGKASKFRPTMYPAHVRDDVHEGKSSNPNNSFIFQGPEPYLFLRAICFGAASVINPTTTAKKKTQGEIWGLKGVEDVTPGAIAAGQIMSIFAASRDVEFGAIGKPSGIKYSELYYFYKEKLILIQDGSDSTRRRIWSRIKAVIEQHLFNNGQASRLRSDNQALASGDESSDLDFEAGLQSLSLDDVGSNWSINCGNGFDDIGSPLSNSGSSASPMHISSASQQAPPHGTYPPPTPLLATPAEDFVTSTPLPPQAQAAGIHLETPGHSRTGNLPSQSARPPVPTHSRPPSSRPVSSNTTADTEAPSVVPSHRSHASRRAGFQSKPSSVPPPTPVVGHIAPPIQALRTPPTAVSSGEEDDIDEEADDFVQVVSPTKASGSSTFVRLGTHLRPSLHIASTAGTSSPSNAPENEPPAIPGRVVAHNDSASPNVDPAAPPLAITTKPRPTRKKAAPAPAEPAVAHVLDAQHRPLRPRNAAGQALTKTSGSK